jgi:hypothetical protein
MKSGIFSLLTIVTLTSASACQNTDRNNSEVINQSNQTMESPVTAEETKKLRHVVLFKFKDDAEPAAVEKAIEAFAALPDKIPQIKEFEWGTNNSPEGLNKGLTHCFLLTFDSEEGRDIYLPHPDHKAFGALLGDILEDVTVVDYWAD